MKRWRAKNPRPQPQQAHAAKKSTQPSRTRDGRFSTYAMMKYGDAGAMLEIGSKPGFVTNDFVLPESTLKHKDLEFEIAKSDFFAHRALVARHNSDIVRLFGDIQMRMFELSIAQIQSHFDDYAEVTTARCQLLLWKLVIKSHTFAGREASFVEKEKAKSTLQKLRQSSLTLSEHNSRFDAQLKICKDMQIDIDTKWVFTLICSPLMCRRLVKL